jgi:hypothetical protein
MIESVRVRWKVREDFVCYMCGRARLFGAVRRRE